MADNQGLLQVRTEQRDELESWAQSRSLPARLDRYMASNDRDFKAKAADIIGLYLNPPQHAAVFCVDEKTAIQSLVVAHFESRRATISSMDQT